MTEHENDQNYGPKPKKAPTIDVDWERLKRKLKKIVPLVALPLVLLVIILNSFFILENKENGVVLRFGQLKEVVTKPGINFKLPLIDTVTKVDVRTIYNMEYGFRSKERRSGRGSQGHCGRLE